MKKIQKILEFYALDGLHMYSKLITRKEWGNKALGKTYLEKYWLDDAEIDKIWKKRMDDIFINQQQGFPEMIFKNDMKTLIMNGGCLFDRNDFIQLQKCMLSIGEERFVVIENKFGDTTNAPALNFIFPSSIKWEEITSGNFVSSVLIESIHKEFFVFGESSNWGKYAANDYTSPVDIIGFKPEYSQLFLNNFREYLGDWQELKNEIPDLYIEKYMNDWVGY